MSIKLIFYLLIMCMLSCTYLSKPRTYQPCHFDRENLTVIGSDFDFKDSICFQQPLLPTIARMLDDYLVIYRASFSKIRSGSLPIFDIKICDCKDTLWAKQQIISELKNRFPFTLMDSIESRRIYNISLVDSTKLIKSKSDAFWPEMYSDSKYFHYRGITYSFLTKEVGFLIFLAKENKFYICKLKEVAPYFGNYNDKYDISIRNEFLASYISSDTPSYRRPQKTIEEVKIYALDSLGFSINLVDEYKIPIKLIKFSTI